LIKIKNHEKLEIEESRFRSVVKAISWRTIGTIDTMILSLFVTGNPYFALKIGFTEIFTKIFFYYLHERIWQKWLANNSVNSKLLLKAISWRIWGTIDTTLLGWLFTGNLSFGFKIGAMELITKIFLFYVHEKLWLKVPKGRMRKYFSYLEEKRIFIINNYGR